MRLSRVIELPQMSCKRGRILVGNLSTKGCTDPFISHHIRHECWHCGVVQWKRILSQIDQNVPLSQRPHVGPSPPVVELLLGNDVCLHAIGLRNRQRTVRR